MKILLATTNRGKFREVASILSGTAIDLLSLADLSGAPAIEENGQTFQENALKKAREICRWSGLTTLADDSGLVVPALGGRPGVQSARFAGPNATDEGNLQKLLNEVSKISESQRHAHYVCALALVTPEGKEVIVEERCEGEIILERRGSGGFGYDPIFFLPELGKTMAEISPAEKNRLSHRGKALKEIQKIICRPCINSFEPTSKRISTPTLKRNNISGTN